MDFIDLKTQYKRIEKTLEPKLKDIMANARFIMGSEVSRLENALCEYTGRKHCISCSSGTDALLMSLMALGVGRGDAVFVPTFTFFSTAEVVSFLGATPIFVDVYEDTFNMDVSKLENAVEYVKKETKFKPKVIMPVDLFGLPADFEKLSETARNHDLIIVEDGAQGFGGAVGERKACSFGTISATSFFPAKPLGCYGDGGAVFTDDDDMAETLKSIRIHGQGTDKYANIRIGINGRLDTVQGAVLLEKLTIFDDEINKKNEIADKYSDLLSSVVRTPQIPKGYYSSWAQYTILAESEIQRDSIIEALKGKGIPTAVYYRNPIHTLDVYSELDYIKYMDYGVSERISKTALSIPIHAYLTDSDIDIITGSLKKAVTS